MPIEFNPASTFDSSGAQGGTKRSAESASTSSKKMTFTREGPSDASATAPVRTSRNSQQGIQTLLSDLIELDIFDLSALGPDRESRQRSLLNHPDSAKGLLVASLNNPAKAAAIKLVLTKNGLEQRSAAERIRGAQFNEWLVSGLNLGDTRVAKQLPYTSRQAYNEAQLGRLSAVHEALTNDRQQNFAAELATRNRASEARLKAFHEAFNPHIDTFVIGRGNNMTSYHEYLGPDDGSILYVGVDDGTWGDDYQLAQRASSLEWSSQAASLYQSNFALAFGDAQVNAKHLFQAMVAAQNRIDFPSISGEVVGVSKAGNDGYDVRVAYSFGGREQLKSIHCNEVIVGTGLSEARNPYYRKGKFYSDDFKPIVGSDSVSLFRTLARRRLLQEFRSVDRARAVARSITAPDGGYFSEEQLASIRQLMHDTNAGRVLEQGPGLPPFITKAEYEALSAFDASKGYTPLVDGNRFVATDRESSSLGQGRSILVWAAEVRLLRHCAARLDLKDDPSVKFDEATFNNRHNEVRWIARSGLNALRNGTLAIDAQSVLRDKDLIWDSCEVRKFEQLPSGKIRVYIDRYTPTADGGLPGLVERTINDKKFWCQLTRTTQDVDQFVYNIGQDNRNIEQLFEGDLEIRPDTVQLDVGAVSQLPLGASLIGQPGIRFVGSAASAGSLNLATMKALNAVIDQEKVPEDTGPGSMPLTLAMTRAMALEKKSTYFDSVNATMDFSYVMDAHLARWGVAEKPARDAFLADIRQARSETPGGLLPGTLSRLIQRHGLQGRLTVDSTAMLTPITRAPLSD